MMSLFAVPNDFIGSLNGTKSQSITTKEHRVLTKVFGPHLCESLVSFVVKRFSIATTQMVNRASKC